MTATALKVHTVRLGDADMANIRALALGDETASQTIRRVLREAAASAARRAPRGPESKKGAKR